MKGAPVFCLLAVIILAGCNPQELKMTKPEKVDWDSLNFVCVKESNPAFDDEADVWYREARELQKRDEERYLPKIVELFEKAVARNHYNAMHRLALLHVESPEGFQGDRRKAVELIERVIKLNVASGYYQMGVFLEQGIGVQEDQAASLTYMRKAADMGNPEAQYAIGRKLTRMDGKELRQRVVPIGKAMLVCALSHGHSQSGYQLSFTLEDEDVPGALAALQRSSALGNASSLYRLEKIFSDGEYGLTKDSARSEVYKRLRAEVQADKSKRFPNLDDICPLPPLKMPGN
jgi:uncharacterized protein